MNPEKGPGLTCTFDLSSVFCLDRLKKSGCHWQVLSHDYKKNVTYYVIRELRGPETFYTLETRNILKNIIEPKLLKLLL